MNEQKVLLIPSGGLSGLSHSAIFKKKIEEFVKNGGTIICFSQQYGYDFAALPGSEVKGYGWQEDVSCHSRAAYIENFHQILASQTELYPDVKLDGYFTDYPGDSKILLRRSKNLMPAMLMYDYGKGMVIAASIYSDWGYINGQTGSTEISLIRDLVRWAKNGVELREYDAETKFKHNLDVDKEVSKIEMILKSPSGEILEKTLSAAPVYEMGAALSKPGIYSVDYVLYSPDSDIIQPETEGFYFCFSRPPEGTLKKPGFSFNITSDGENYINGQKAVFTLHIKNNTSDSDTIKCKAEMPHHGVKFTEYVVVPPESTVSFEKQITVDKTDRLMASFYSSGNDFLGGSERGISVFEPSIDAAVTTDRQQYTPGQKIVIDSTIKNNLKVDMNLTLILNAVDVKNNEIYYNAKPANLTAEDSDSWRQEVELPDDIVKGPYKIKLSVFSNSRLVGAAGAHIEIPGPLLFEESELPPSFSDLLTIAMGKTVYAPGEQVLAKVIINNKGKKIDSGVLNIRVLPDVNKGYLSGVIKDSEGIPIKGARINNVYTDNEGRYRLEQARTGRYQLDVSAPGYDRFMEEVNILAGDNNLDIVLPAATYGSIRGTLEGAIGSRLTLEPVNVTGSDRSTRYAIVSIDSSFEFIRIPAGAYDLSVQPEGITESVEVDGDEDIVLNGLGGGAAITEDIPGPDQYEPNSGFDSAKNIMLRQDITCTVFPEGDEDWFSVDITRQGIFYIKMQKVPKGLRPSLKIYDSSGKWVSQKGGSAGEEISLETEIDKPGRYYILLRDWYSNFSSTETYSFRAYFLDTQDEREPDNSKEEAETIEFGRNYFATIAAKGDSDFYKISVPDSGNVIVYLTHVPSNIRPYIKLYKSSRASWIDSAAGFGGEDLTMEFETEEPSNYFLQVQDRYNSESSFLRYTLLALYIPDADFSSIDSPIFNMDMDIIDIIDSKEIDIDVPAIDRTGKYYLQAALRSPDPDKNSQAVERFYISDAGVPEEPPQAADMELSYLGNGDALFGVGEKAGFKFRVVNKGNAIGRFDVDFKFQDLFGRQESGVLEPGAAKELVFEFELPVDYKEGLYEAEYLFNGEKKTAGFKISGLKLEVDAEFENNIFTIKIRNKGAVGNIPLFAEVRCGSHENKEDFILTGYKELIFNIPDVGEEEKIYYGIYFASGKAAYLNSFLLGDTPAPGPDLKIIEAVSDKADYEDGEHVVIHWKIMSDDERSIRLTAGLIGPDAGAVELFDEQLALHAGLNIVDKDTEPVFTGQGLHKITYSLIYEDSIIAQGSIFFDVGEEVRPEIRLDKREYFKGEEVEFIARCFSSTGLEGTLSLLVDGETIKHREIGLDGYEEFRFKVKDIGIGNHRAYINLSYDDKSVKSATESFNVLPRPEPNHSPVLFTIGEKSVTAGDALEFLVEAEDLDRDSLIYSAEGLPEGAAFNERKFFWRPQAARAGDYFIKFSVSDRKETAFEIVKIVVKSPSPPPLSSLALPLSGTAPLEVNFNADSIDKKKTIKYEWDFDGKGVYDFDSGESGNALFVYTGNGSFPAALRVTDEKCNTDVYNVVINVDKNPEAPVLDLTAAPSKGMAPCRVYFQGAVLSKADVCKFEWDFNGDGVYDAASEESSEIVKTYGTPGTYKAGLRVTNSLGLSGSKEVLVEIKDPMVLSVEPIVSGTKGNIPFDVDFDASLDAENKIQKYQWDFEGDGVYDYVSLESPLTTHTYSSPGLYTPTLRVTDKNNVSAEVKKELRLSAFNPGGIKHGVINVNSAKGKAPLTVQFSYNAGFESEGVEYYWDFEGDGICDSVTSEPEAEFTYYIPGIYLAEASIEDRDIIVTSVKTAIYVTERKDSRKKIGVDDNIEVNKKKSVFKNKIGRIEMADKTSLLLPAGVLGADDAVDINRLEDNKVPQGVPLEKDLVSTGEYREYKFKDHKGAFEKEMTITIPYQDDDEDGIVDGRNINELSLDAYWFNEETGEWQLLSDALIFPKENIVTVRTNHFSLFTLVGQEVSDEDAGQSSEEGEVSSNCFIAASAFGTPLAREVRILCEFRDNYLLKTNMGIQLVRVYYYVSPPVAKFIQDRPFVKSLIRLHIKLIASIIYTPRPKNRPPFFLWRTDR